MPLDNRASPLEIIAITPICVIIIKLSQISEISPVFGTQRDEGPIPDISTAR